MPDKNEIVKEDKSEEKIIDDKAVKEDNQSYQNHKWAWLFGIILVLLFLGVVASSLSFAAWTRHNKNLGTIRVGGYGDIERGFGRHNMRGYMGGGNGAVSNQVVISGVVTSVNGNSFILAGNGATNNIQTDSNTKYSNGTKVNVNDSVTVAGNTNNNTFTATQVVIRNNSNNL